MIVDSSAVIAILLKEPGYQGIRDRLATSEQVSIGAPTVVESSLVLSSRLGRAGKTLLARFLQEAEIRVEVRGSGGTGDELDRCVADRGDGSLGC